MSYQILSFSTSPFTQARIYSLLCDTAADLPASVDGYSVGQGWTAKVIEDGSSYIANAAGSWIQQPSSVFTSNYYTKAETDGRLSAHVCTCDTAGNVADKVATTTDDFVLREGAIISVKFTNSNTITDASSHPITINVNDTGAFRVYYGSGGYLGLNQVRVFGYANHYIHYVFSNNRWVWITFSSLDILSAMSQAEATAGTANTSRAITAKVLHDTILEQTTPLKSALTDIINSGGKNRLKLSGSDVTGYGIQCTFDYAAGTIHLDGINPDKTCTGSFNIQCADSQALDLTEGVIYHFSCDGYTTDNDTIGIYVYTSGATPLTQFDTFDHNEAAWESAWEQTSGFRLFIRQGTVVDNITLKPMISLKTDYDLSQTFEPYCPTLAELYQLVKSYHP